MASSHLVSSSPTPAHQLHHPFRRFEAHPSPLSTARDHRGNRSSHAHQEDQRLAGSDELIEVDDQEEYGDQTQGTDMLEDDDQADMADDFNQHASEGEYEDEVEGEEEEEIDDEEEEEEEEEEQAEQAMDEASSPTLDASFATSMSIATAPPTPSPNPYGTTFPSNGRDRVMAKSPFLPAHLFEPNPNAMPPSSSPCRMDISPAPTRPRCSIPNNSQQSNGFHFSDDPFAAGPSRSQPKTHWMASPTTSETRRAIGIKKVPSRPKLPTDSVPGRTGQKSSPCPIPRPSSDGMDIDSPVHVQPTQDCGMNICSSSMGAEDQQTGPSLFRQRTSRSTSQSSTGKRSRSDDEDDDFQVTYSRRGSGSSSHGRGPAPQKRASSPPRLALPAQSQAGRLFAPTTRSPVKQTGALSPFLPSSSPSETVSPSIKAAANMTLGRKAGQRSLSGFRFPASKSNVPSVAIPPSGRPQHSGKGSLGSASGLGVAARRPGLGVVQSSATLFGRHQSTSTTRNVVNRQRDASGRPASKTRRAISFASGKAGNMSLFLQGNSMVVDPDEDDDESELDASTIFNCSPVPRGSLTANPLASGTWPKTSESPIRPNRSASYNDSSVRNLTRKTSAPGPSSSSSLAPPPFPHGMAYQSPAKPLVAALGAAVESPVGMPFSEKERAGKILPCHKVSNDGLMRISPETMDRLLEGSYDESISHKVIVDCRFGYEFDGGHIRAAINIQDKKAVDSMLLKGEIFARGQSDVPLPSESGKADSAGRRKKVVVVFHCEYSAMRAPTVAKYLREQDRHMNMPHYPALHYPEVYILEGGYAKYFAHSPQHCEGSYVRMDDPNHRSDRHADLNQFRTRESAVFSRAKSYTYGESKKSAKGGSVQKQPIFGQARGDSHRPRDMFGARQNSESSSQYSKIVEEDEDDLVGHQA